MFANISFLGEGFLAAVFLLCSFSAVFGLTALKLKLEIAEKVLIWAGRASFVHSQWELPLSLARHPFTGASYKIYGWRAPHGASNTSVNFGDE